MKVIKRILLIALVLCLALPLFSCKKGEEPAESTQPPVEDISFLDYTLIRPDKCSEKLLDETSVLYMKLKKLSGADNQYTSDWLEKGKEPDSEAKEILIGHTNRPETEQVLSQLSGSEYAVAVVGNKVVIAGITDSITPAAVQYFVSTYLSDGADGKLAGDLFYKASADTAVIVDKSEPVYKLVRAHNEAEGMVDMMYKVSDVIADISGVTLPVGTDRLNSGDSYDSESYEILFGDTAYPETKAVKAEVDPDSYAIRFVGNKIVIFAWNTEAMQKAADALADMLRFACYTDADGKSTVSVVKENILKENEESEFYKDVPFTANGRNFDSVYDAYDGAMELYWDKADETMLTDYASSLEKMGYTKHQELNNDSIHSVTYVKNKAQVHTYYLKRLNELRVITQDNAVLAPNPTQYEKKCDVAVTQLGLDYETDTTKNGGMGYLIRLEDGTFVVIDGGDNLDTNAANLYELMREQKPASVENIVVTAWIITHGHSDHYGVIRNFMANYKDRVTVKMLVGNDPPDYIHENCDTPGHPFTFRLEANKLSGCVYMKAHTGQQLFLPGFTMTILYTHEDVYPAGPMMKFNSHASMVFDGVTNDTRFVWLADIESEGAKRVKDMYYTDIKCDVMQIAHHGVKGAAPDLYELCAPTIAYWPAAESITANSTYWNMAQNKWIRENVEQLIISKDGNFTIWFGEQLDVSDVVGSEDFGSDYSKFY